MKNQRKPTSVESLAANLDALAAVLGIMVCRLGGEVEIDMSSQDVRDIDGKAFYITYNQTGMTLKVGAPKEGE